LRTILGTTPVPVSEIESVPAIVLSVSTTEADSAVAVVGLKVTFRTVLLFGATESGAAGEDEKSLAFVPDREITEIVNVEVPVLLIVTCFALLAMLTV